VKEGCRSYLFLFQIKSVFNVFFPNVFLTFTTSKHQGVEPIHGTYRKPAANPRRELYTGSL